MEFFEAVFSEFVRSLFFVEPEAMEQKPSTGSQRQDDPDLFLKADALSRRIVVTPNYRDRTSPYRWMVRIAHQPLATAIAFRQVETGPFTIVRAGVEEEGFGCSVVALCDEARCWDREPQQPATKQVVLTFTGDEFRDSSDSVVKSGQRLSLDPSGVIFATVQRDS